MVESPTRELQASSEVFELKVGHLFEDLLGRDRLLADPKRR